MCDTIKECRIKAGLTQQEMANKLEIPLRTISDWERGLRNPPKYVKRLIIKELNQIAKEKATPTEKNK